MPHLKGLALLMQMDKNRPGMSMKPFDSPVVPLMTQHGPAGAFPHASSSVAGLSSGLGGMSLNSSPQPNQASQGQYGHPPQVQGGYAPTGQGVAGFSPLGQGQHGQLPQPGQGQYGQSSQAGPGQYGQANQTGQGQYGQANQIGQSQYGQPNQAGQGQYGQPNQAGQGQYRQPHQAGQGQYGQSNQAGQTSGGFDTYPDMSSNSQPFDGNKPYSANPNPTSNGANPHNANSYPTGNGGNSFPQGQGSQQQQQSYQAQQGNAGSYAAYPDLGSGNNTGYNQAGAPLLDYTSHAPFVASPKTKSCPLQDAHHKSLGERAIVWPLQYYLLDVLQ